MKRISWTTKLYRSLVFDTEVEATVYAIEVLKGRKFIIEWSHDGFVIYNESFTKVLADR